MRHPKVGETILAAGDEQARVGETLFLCSTQENAMKISFKNLKRIKKEALEIITDAEDDDYTKERINDIIIYEMKRIA